MSVAELRKKFETEENHDEKPQAENVVSKGFVAEKVSALENPQPAAVQPRTLQFTSEREGDFFAAVEQQTVVLLGDGNDLGRIQEAVRSAHSDIGDSIVNLSVSSFGDVSPLTEKVLAAVATDEQLRILYSTRTVSNHQLDFSASLDDANLHTVVFQLSFSLPQPRLYEEFRAACARALSLDNPSALSTALMLDGEGTLLISGDKQLEEFLTELIRGGVTKVPHVVVSVASKVEKQSVRIVASLIGELESREAAFDFGFSLSDFHLLDNLREAIRSELELDSQKQLSLVAVVDGCSFSLSEKVLVEVLSQKHSGDIHVEVQVVNVTAYRQATLFCRFANAADEEEASVVFRYTLVESSLLQALCCEISGELEAEFDRTRLTCVSGDQLIVISSDTVLRELLHTESELHFVLHPLQSKAVSKAKAVTCVLDGEEAKFQFNYNLLDSGLLELFRAECRAETDLMPNEKITLTALVDGSQIVIDRDSTLLELLSNEGDLVVLVEEARASPKQIVNQKQVTCTLGADTATFTFSFNVLQDGLLEHLYSEIKDELDLLPNEEIVISFSPPEEDGGPLEVGTDRILRDVLIEAEQLTFKVSLKKKVQRQNARQVSVLCKSGGEEVQYDISYRDSDVLSDLLQQEIRSELELDGTVAISFTDADGAALDENSLRQLFDKSTTTVVLNVVLPKSQRDALEEMPLNRNAELHALYYDWQDILGETFDASDLRLVLQNVKQNGKPLPPGDAIFAKVAEFANAGSERRTESDLLPFLGSMTAHYADGDVSTLCHLCRDVIAFIVDVSPQHRYRRAVSQVFRAISVNEAVSLPQLVSLLSKSGVDESITGTVVEGFGEQLSLRDFRAILEQLFGESVQDVVDLITAAQDTSPTTSRRGEREVHMLRRQRLLSDLKHALDGICEEQLGSLPVQSLKLCIAALLSPNTLSAAKGEARVAAAESWYAEKTSSEVAAHNFLAELASFKSSAVDEVTLHEFTTLLVSPELDPSYLLSVSAAASALAAWAIAAAQLVCHNRRLMFPHVLSGGQQPLSARKPEGPKGVSAPRLLRNLYEEREDNAVANYSPNSGAPRFEPKLRHLCNDLQITEAQFPISYRQLTNRQLSEAPQPPS